MIQMGDECPILLNTVFYCFVADSLRPRYDKKPIKEAEIENQEG